MEGKDELMSQKVEKAFPGGRRCRGGSSCISAEIVEGVKEMLAGQREQERSSECKATSALVLSVNSFCLFSSLARAS